MDRVTGSDQDRSWRRYGGYVIPTVAVVLALVAPRVVWHRLPNPVAGHWSASGVPDGSLNRTADWLLLAGAVALVGLLPLVLTRRIRGAARLGAAIAAFAAAFVVSLRLLTLWANLDVADWTQARPLPAAAIASAFLIGGIAAAAGAWLDRGLPDETAPEPTTSPPPRGPAVPWSGSASSSAMMTLVPLVAVALAVVAVVVLPPVAGTIAAVSLAIGAVVGVLFGRVTVRVDSSGLAVRMGWFGWPRISVPLNEIAEVSVERVEPTQYGGWGLRLLPRTVAVVIRRGDGIRVRRTDGRILVVTVDGAATGAGVLQAYRSGAPHR